MAKYIPPHKRNLNHTNTTSKSSVQQHVSFAKDCVANWFVVPFSYDTEDDDDEHELPCSLQLKQFLYQPIERKRYSKLMILVFKDPNLKVVTNDFAKAPWVSILEKLHHDLLSSFVRARKEMCNHGDMLKVKPDFVFRLGKVLFHGNSLINLEYVNKSSVIESALGGLRRSYHTNIPESFVEAILSEFIHRIGLKFEEELDYYHVKVFDRYQTHIITCRCIVVEAVEELNLYEIVFNKLRHLVVDLTCLEKNLDLRLMLSSKRTLASLNDEEKHSLNQLLKSAVIDSDQAKGGLRWPLGKDSLDGRFSVVGSCHTKDKVFKNSVMRLKVRQADRFDFETSTGEVTHEASLRMTELNDQLQDGRVELEPLADMVREMVKLIWDNFLCWDGSYV